MKNLSKRASGIRNKQEFSSALFYFNKAEFLKKSGLTVIHPGLVHSARRLPARKYFKCFQMDVLKAWGKNYEGARISLEQVEGMLADYRIPGK